jgi:hypothetical protein
VLAGVITPCTVYRAETGHDGHVRNFTSRNTAHDYLHAAWAAHGGSDV